MDVDLKNEATKRGFFIEDKDFLAFSYTNKKSVADKIESNSFPLIFTSQHGVKGFNFLRKKFNFKIKKNHCYAIEGTTSRTAAGFEVINTALNAAQLAERIIENQESNVLHCTTKHRRHELASKLTEAGVNINVCEVYDKKMLPQKVADFDGVLFFSPSQFDAFTACNHLMVDTPIFCIGATTAKHAKNLNHKNIIVAEQANEAAVLTTVYEYFK